MALMNIKDHNLTAQAFNKSLHKLFLQALLKVVDSDISTLYRTEKVIKPDSITYGVWTEYIANLENELTAVRTNFRVATDKIASSEKDIAAIENKIAAIEKDIAATEKTTIKDFERSINKVTSLKEAYKTRFLKSKRAHKAEILESSLLSYDVEMDNLQSQLQVELDKIVVQRNKQAELNAEIATIKNQIATYEAEKLALSNAMNALSMKIEGLKREHAVNATVTSYKEVINGESHLFVIGKDKNKKPIYLESRLRQSAIEAYQDLQIAIENCLMDMCINPLIEFCRNRLNLGGIESRDSTRAAPVLVVFLINNYLSKIVVNKKAYNVADMLKNNVVVLDRYLCFNTRTSEKALFFSQFLDNPKTVTSSGKKDTNKRRKFLIE